MFSGEDTADTPPCARRERRVRAEERAQMLTFFFFTKK